MIGVGLEWFLKQTGSGASSHLSGGGFIRSRGGIPHPDIQFHFLPSQVFIYFCALLPCGGSKNQLERLPHMAGQKQNVYYVFYMVTPLKVARDCYKYFKLLHICRLTKKLLTLPHSIKILLILLLLLTYYFIFFKFYLLF